MSTYWPTDTERTHPLDTLTITVIEAIANALGLDPARLRILLREAVRAQQ